MLNYLLFAKNSNTNKIFIVIVYINNYLFFRPNFIKINIIKSFLIEKYKIKNLGSCKQFLEIKLEQNLEKKLILLSQKVYIKKVLKYTHILNSKLIYFFIIFKINFYKNKNKLLDENFTSFYQSLIHKHMFIYVMILVLEFLFLANFY